jgi:hypothetical protein
MSQFACPHCHRDPDDDAQQFDLWHHYDFRLGTWYCESAGRIFTWKGAGGRTRGPLPVKHTTGRTIAVLDELMDGDTRQDFS